ncbi:MAG TPA: hypothetical protein VMM79_00830 [Longimicrobiales bacterium]|nr:hypothetical protein [Longimicrobiales bacterium]
MARASALEPFAPVMNRYLAFTLARTGHCDEAIEHANTAIDLAPEHPDGYLVRWTCHVLAGQFEQAAAAGRVDDAFVALERALVARDPILVID